MPVQKKVDVVMVGAGWTAAILAWKLTEAGLRCVSLEQGPSRWTDPDFLHDHDPVRYHARHAMMVNLRRETWTWRPRIACGNGSRRTSTTRCVAASDRVDWAGLVLDSPPGGPGPSASPVPLPPSET